MLQFTHADGRTLWINHRLVAYVTESTKPPGTMIAFSAVSDNQVVVQEGLQSVRDGLTNAALREGTIKR